MFILENIKYKKVLDIKYLKINSKVTSIIGPSGSGKSTTLKLLNKLITPDSGEITYNNKNLKDIDSIDLRREITMLPQNPVIYEGNLRDNLNIGLVFQEKEILPDEELTKILESVSLNKNLDDEINNYSGGEKQRVCLARLLATKPKVVLLDEPSSGLDDDTEDFVINTMVNYAHNTDASIIMVTHSKEVALKYSDEIIEIREGKIWEQ